MRREISAGLARRPKEIPPKYFYDRRGSELFEAITRLPEYYPTRAERAILESFVPGWLRALDPAALVELGAGAADKTRILLDALAIRDGSTYVPIDISAGFLESAAAALREDYPGLTVRPVAADLTVGIPPLPGIPRPAVFAFLGGTIGNFEPDRAARLLKDVGANLTPDCRFLLGVDLIKQTDVLERAYNDDAGVTAEFNLNALRVINRELDADFDPHAFRHRAFYDPEKHRIEMHLVATRHQTVTIPGAGPTAGPGAGPGAGRFEIEAGESIRTEISCKYDRDRVAVMFRAAALDVEEWIVGEPGFALVVGTARAPEP